MSDRETEGVKEFKGDIGGVNNRLADSAATPQAYQLIEGIMPWEGEHKRIFGKKPHGKMTGITYDNLAVITMHSIPGNHILYQTREGLFMDTRFHAETVDWSTRSGISDFATLQAIDYLVINFKDKGLWDKLIGFYPFAGGTATAHAQNLISSSYPITWVNGPSHSGLGVFADGVSSYAYITGSQTALPQHGHLSCYVHTPASTIGDYRDYMGLGNEGASARYYLIQAVDLAYIGYWGNAANAITAIDFALWSGLLLNTRTSNVEHNIYRNGLPVGFTSVALETNAMPTTLPIGLFCRIDNGGVPMELSNVLLSSASFGHALTAAESVDYYNIVQAYQTLMGRQV